MLNKYSSKSEKLKQIKDNSRFVSGLKGEEIALQQFQKDGFTPVSHRYKTKYGEIDLILEDIKNKIIVFVEVKRRKNIYDYSNIISKKQWQRIYNASNTFLAENNNKYQDYIVRYDAIICFTNSDNIVHIENIFTNDIQNMK